MWRFLARTRRAKVSSSPSLEVHVPGSPSPLFFNMVRCLTHSLRQFGGAHRNAPVIFTVGGETEDPGLANRLSWLKPNGIELRWVPAERFRAQSFFATGHQMFSYKYRSDVVLKLDADTLIAGPLDELVDDVARHRVLAGLIAHGTPFGTRPALLRWEGLFRHCGLGCHRLEHEYSGWGYMAVHPDHRYCPAYFNAGVICAPGEYLRAIAHISEPLARKVLQYTGEPFFVHQLTLALAIAQLRIPTRALPMRYNFANDPLLEALHAAEVPHARILHLLRRHQDIYKTELFADLGNVAALLRRDDLRLINRRAQEVLSAIWPALQAEEGRQAAA